MESSDQVRPHVVVTGLMGVGKSTTAQALATQLARPWSDSDRDLEQVFGLTGSELADRHGVDELHRLESSMLLGRLADTQSAVISAAAWIVEDERCREALAKRAYVVTLDAPVEVIIERSMTGDHRRSIDRVAFEALALRRRPLFAAIADLELDATRPPTELATAIADQLAT